MFVLASIVLMVVDHKQGHLESVRSVISTLVYPLQYVVSLPMDVSHHLSQSLATRKRLLEENDRLREERFLLNARLQRFSVLQEENRRLRALLESSVELRERVLVAELVEVELQPLRQQIIINKGGRAGVYGGQPVVDAGGIMGQVIHVGPFSSTVLLVTDPSHSIPVQINRNGLRSIAIGTGQSDRLLLEHIPVNADVEEGDLIVSSGLGRRFPRGYPVGVVSRISHVPGEMFSDVNILTSAKLGQSREVLLVWPYDAMQEGRASEDVAMK